ncbi:hypothetical protein NAX55_000813 [Salmonella enterica]|nr:hypothetical protein [Salmonella enterica]EJG8985011.1 hypothetical protein [Salmonella enterica]
MQHYRNQQKIIAIEASTLIYQFIKGAVKIPLSTNAGVNSKIWRVVKVDNLHDKIPH